MKNRILCDLVLLLIFFLMGIMLGVGICQGSELACENGRCSQGPVKQRSHPSIVRLTHTDHVGPGYFTGTLIDIKHEDNLILTCAHPFEFAGNTMVTYANGQTEWASIIKKDHAIDLALLRVQRNNRMRIQISSTVPAQGEWVAGFGCGYSEFRESQGKVSGYLWFEQPESMVVPPDGFSFIAGVRQGDSGGPVINANGELAGVIFGGDASETSAVDCVAVSAFINKALVTDRKRISDPVSPPADDPAAGTSAQSEPGATLLNHTPWLSLIPVKPTIQQTNPKKEQNAHSTEGQKAPSTGLGLPNWLSLAVRGGKFAAAAAGITIGTAATGGTGWAAWLAVQGAVRVYKRRKQRKRGQATKADSFSAIARDDEEAKQLLQLSQLEGRSPVHDAIVGRFAFDTIESLIHQQPTGPAADALRKLRFQIESRFNEVAPAAVLHTKEN